MDEQAARKRRRFLKIVWISLGCLLAVFLAIGVVATVAVLFSSPGKLHIEVIR